MSPDAALIEPSEVRDPWRSHKRLEGGVDELGSPPYSRHLFIALRLCIVVLIMLQDGEEIDLSRVSARRGWGAEDVDELFLRCFEIDCSQSFSLNASASVIVPVAIETGSAGLDADPLVFVLPKAFWSSVSSHAISLFKAPDRSDFG